MKIRPLGNMGNQMLQYMFALSVRDRVGDLDIFGHDIPFWNITAPVPANFSKNPLILRGQQLIDADQVASLIRKGKIRDCEMHALGFQMSNYGSPQRYESVFNAETIDVTSYGSDHVVFNVRGAEILKRKHGDYGPVPLSFIDRVIEESGAKPVFMGQLGDDFYSQRLRERYADAIFQPSRGALIDFEVMRRSHQIAVAVSTFSWVAAWLSKAQIIHLPLSGILNPRQRPDIDLLPENDERYRFYDFQPRRWTASPADIDDLWAPHEHRQLDAAQIRHLKTQARRKTAFAKMINRIKLNARATLKLA
jgi:hypothetical protein